VGILLVLRIVGCREVVHTATVPQLNDAKVVFVRLTSWFDGDHYVIELPNGSVTKQWLDGSTTTPQEIREETSVEYDGNTLRIAGPGKHKLEIPGFRVQRRGK